jgi:hypothetical protein
MTVTGEMLRLEPFPCDPIALVPSEGCSRLARGKFASLTQASGLVVRTLEACLAGRSSNPGVSPASIK